MLNAISSPVGPVLRKWRWLQVVPLVRQAKKGRRKLKKAYFRHFGANHLRRALRTCPSPRLVIGAAGRCDAGWIPTEKDFLNLLCPQDWDQFFPPNSVAALLAEHVWEHLTPDEARVAADTCFTYLRPGGYLRIAIPDGLHPDPRYVALVKVQGQTPDDHGDFYLNDHKVLYTYRTGRELFQSAGVRVQLLEYFDEDGTFHEREWSPEEGTIWRSKRFDRRNQGGRLVYTSIILDAFKMGDARGVDPLESEQLTA
jgi:predicted SAM-dependent methyltransferase